MPKRFIAIAGVLSGCVIITSFFAGLGGAWIGGRILDRNQNDGTGTQTVQITNEDSQVIDVAEEASPAVVSIVVTKDLDQYEDSDPFDFYSNRNRSTPGEETQIGAGSGFIISKEGLILTNRHVVNDTQANYTVVLNDGTKYTAEVIGRDALLDIAVVKIETDEDLPTLNFADSSQIKVGQFVIAIGNSLGEFSNTVSTGIISGLSRSIVAGDRDGGTQERLEGVIQTDASINPGNSGGPLLDINGNVVGINVAIASDAENIGFAIPINAVRQVVDSVVEFGEIVRPYIGVRYTNITEEYAKQNNLPVNYGAHISTSTDPKNPGVIAGGPADKAGLKAGDIITEVNGKKLTDGVTLQDEGQKYKVGDKIQLKYFRGKEEKTVEVTLEKRPIE